MSTGHVQIYYGAGRGKTNAALGNALRTAGKGKNVYVVQFLKGKGEDDIRKYCNRLEPELKFFCFERAEGYYDELSAEEQEEEKINMKNGLNFAKKVLVTGECDMLILDEVLGLVDNQIVSVEDLKNLVQAKEDEVELIFTGRVLDDAIRPLADEIYNIVAEKCNG